MITGTKVVSVEQCQSVEHVWALARAGLYDFACSGRRGGPVWLDYRELRVEEVTVSCSHSAGWLTLRYEWGSK